MKTCFQSRAWMVLLMVAGAIPGRGAESPERADVAPRSGGWCHEELRRFKAEEAMQGVAVDAAFFYVIDNRGIGKYRKAAGERVGGWDGSKDGRIKHLDAGVVLDGRLYCAHSNFPDVAEQSSVESRDTATMQQARQHRLDHPPGSLTSSPPLAETDEQRPGFESLFDGKTLSGWEQKGNWVIEDGAIYRKGKGGSLTYTAKPMPDDFELRFEWKVSKGCNSGVYYRPGQYEYQVLDNANSPYGENPRQAAASLFFCMAPSKDASKPFGEWNEGRVICQGTVIQHWLNGEKVIDFDYADPKWAKEVELLRIRGANLAARGGKLSLQDHGLPVWFRGIRLRTIPPEEKLVRSDFTPMPIPAAALEKENQRVRGMLKAREKK